MPPQRKTAHGGESRFWAWEELVGTQQPRSRSTVLTTESSCVSEASKNISRLSLEGWGPLYCGGPLLALPVPVVLPQLAALAMVSSLGLNWNSTRCSGAPGLASEPSREGSYSWREAFSNLVGAPVAAVADSSPGLAMALPYFPASRKPWWAISIVSVSTLPCSAVRDGPVHRTGTTRLSCHWATSLPDVVIAWMTAVAPV